MTRQHPVSQFPAATRRSVLASFIAMIGFYGTARAAQLPFPPVVEPFRLTERATNITAEVLPKSGAPTGLVFGDSLQKLIAAGVLDPKKFRAAEKNIPEWVERALTAPSNDPIVFIEATAPYLVDLLWPLGLANRARFNEVSPIATVSIPSFASTGGWNLGREPNGYVYFNQVHAVRLSGQEEARVKHVASTTYRPCCNNSTFYQDCNHGSALLGLLELGASQGMTIEGLYGLALTANSFWFPDNYLRTALYFSNFHSRSWSEVAPKLVLGPDFSSLSGWEKNVNDRLRQANVTLSGDSKGQQAC